MKTMRERKQNRGKFILKATKKRGYFLISGSSDDGSGETRACARTTMRISEAQTIKTAKSAEAMRRLLKERYGLETQIMVWERRYDS